MPKADKAKLTQTATTLAAKPEFQPVGNETKCNFFLQAFATGVFDFDGFANLSANQIEDLLAGGTGGWTVLFSKAAGPAGVDNQVLQTAFGAAQDAANDGYLTAIAMKEAGGAHGHCAAVVPGTLTASGKWQQASLASNMPIVAQAGKDVFAAKALSFGVRPEDFKANAFVIAVNKA
jgi:predicted methyltransferase